MLTQNNTTVILVAMNWQNLISEILAAGLSQNDIGQRINRSQAWVSAAAQGKYDDLRWRDGEALRALHAEVVGKPANLNPKEAA